MVWTPGWNGFAQGEYRDQMGSALPGEIAFGSENELIDSGVVIEATSPKGIPAGRGVFYRAHPTATGHREATNNWGVTLGEAADTIATFAGVSVRAHQMDGDTDTGEAVWAPRRMANYLRYSRVGGRIWVELDPAEADVEAGLADVYVDKLTGLFASAAGTNGIQIPHARWYSGIEEYVTGRKMAIVELNHIAQ